MERLYDKLISYKEKDYYPMHMPGHKQNTALMSMENPYAIDITEIEGFDNLHQPEGVLLELSERISRIYGSVKSYPLINGSTAGILAGVSAATNRDDKVLLARNSHKSVYHAIALRGLKPAYCYPQPVQEISINGGILTKEIEEALITHKDIKLVIVTSPTYEGVVSDIETIAETVHRYGARLLVDEAHGAHFGFHEGFPKSAVSLGADIIIQSLHKTLPAFTQTAVLHSNTEELNRKIEQYLAIYQSSSPSYLLMAGIDRCIRMLEDNAKDLFNTYNKNLNQFYHSMKECKKIKLMSRDFVGSDGIFDLDPSKLTISVRNTLLSGHQLQEQLREKYHIVMEMEAPDYVLGMTSICDTDEGFKRLTKALLEIDKETGRLQTERRRETEPKNNPVQVMLPGEAMEKSVEKVKLEDSSGRTAASFISLFPPGTPLLIPGERIDEDLIRYIKQVKHQGISITGLAGVMKEEIEIIK